jgi:hypothetical protein
MLKYHSSLAESYVQAGPVKKAVQLSPIRDNEHPWASAKGSCEAASRERERGAWGGGEGCNSLGGNFSPVSDTLPLRQMYHSRFADVFEAFDCPGGGGCNSCVSALHKATAFFFCPRGAREARVVRERGEEHTHTHAPLETKHADPTSVSFARGSRIMLQFSDLLLSRSASG